LASELARSGAEVVVGDRETRTIPGCKVVRMDFLDKGALIAAMKTGYDLISSAVPGSMGFGVMEAAIKAGVDLVDVSFGEENPLTLDEKARRAGIVVVPDCGVAPGFSNFLVGLGMRKVKNAREAHIKVGGLPQKPKPPLNYRLVFSAEAFVDEYTRKARIVNEGKVREVEALSGLESFRFPGVGELECFYTDGLRTLIDTLKLTNMDEKTIRYPGHVDKVKTMLEMGLFAKEPRIHGIRPRDFIEEFMSATMRLAKGERDMTIMEVEVKGENGAATYRMLDRYDEKSEIPSMSRTTGYPIAVLSLLVAEKKIKQKGVVPLEILGMDSGISESILDGLRQRNIHADEEVVHY
jgi:saccharopine dehydrogenase-like NADP-dependent oxidoreductase